MGFGTLLVLRPPDNCRYSVVVVFRTEAQCAGNGYSLFKRCNDVVEYHSSALRVGLSALMDGVASLGKGVAIPGESRLALNAGAPTESAIIRWTEYRLC